MKHAYITCPSWLGANSPCSLRDEGYVRSTAATVGRAIGPMAVMTAGMKGCLDRFCMKCCPTNTIYPILRTIHMWRISIESMIWYVFSCTCMWNHIQWIHMFFFVYIYNAYIFQTELASYKDCFKGGHEARILMTLLSKPSFLKYSFIHVPSFHSNSQFTTFW